MGDQPERYSEEEVGLILRRAAEIQAGRSMTLAELEAAASEVGIEGALVRRAAMDLRTRREPEAVELEGVFGATRLAFERRVEGVVGPDDWPAIVVEIRRQLGIVGVIPESADKQLEWRANEEGHGSERQIRVSIVARHAHTVIRVEERTGGLAGGLYGGLLGGGLPAGVAWIVPVCVAAIGFPPLIPVFLGLWFFALWYFARTIQRKVLGGRHAELRALADGLEEVAHDSVAARQ